MTAHSSVAVDQAIPARPAATQYNVAVGDLRACIWFITLL